MNEPMIMDATHIEWHWYLFVVDVELNVYVFNETLKNNKM
jgi:hypothetical protein